nr:MAG: hypothetical protein DIU74_12930 [Pseudomonadota bacterium]
MYQGGTQVFGALHAGIGAFLVGLWGLPFPVVEAVAHHHEPQRVRQTGFDVLGATAVAHALSGLGDAGSFDIALLPDTKVDAAYLASLNAPFTWEEAERRVQESLKQGASMA